jgi:hypothetical protein
MQLNPIARDACANCGAPLSGRYCSACGEAVLDPAARTVRHFISSSLLDEIIHLDSKFWSTVRMLLFKPGALTVAFINGRRKAYIGPVKLLLASIFAFVLLTQSGFVAALHIGFVALSIAPAAPPRGATIRETTLFVDRFGVLTQQLDRRIGSESDPSTSLRAGGPGGAAQEQFHDRIQQFAQPLTFGNVFFIAAGLLLLFRRRLPYYVDHLVFSMHTVSFVLLSSMLLIPAFRLDQQDSSLTLPIVLIVGAWQFGYLTTAIRRMYLANEVSKTRARLRAFGAAVIVYLLNGVFVTAVQMLAGWYAISRL